tara:strand:+ start:468 stop:674 length:207 start_codon:yes stop_codon:yes gene_type:complete
VRNELARFFAGAVLLLAIDVLAELVIFEWLEWNGTTKNDWFFMLWWGCVLFWTTYSGIRVWRALRAST